MSEVQYKDIIYLVIIAILLLIINGCFVVMDIKDNNIKNLEIEINGNNNFITYLQGDQRQLIKICNITELQKTNSLISRLKIELNNTKSKYQDIIQTNRYISDLECEVKISKQLKDYTEDFYLKVIANIKK